jgi:hypothetical protein
MKRIKTQMCLQIIVKSWKNVLSIAIIETSDYYSPRTPITEFLCFCNGVRDCLLV